MYSKKLISDRYKDLAAELGDSYLKLNQLKKHIENLETMIMGLDQSAPIMQKAEEMAVAANKPKCEKGKCKNGK